jgi:hypothetical protein
MHRFLCLLLLATGCNSILGIPEVELETCENPIAPLAGYGNVNLNPSGNVRSIATRITLRGRLNAATRPDQLQLELFDGSSFPGAADPVPGTYDLVGSETIYDNPGGCGICVRIFTQIDANGGNHSRIYMASAGTLRLTMTEGRLVGSLEDVELRHVNIGSSPMFTTTDNSSGCTTRIDRADFDLPIVPEADAGTSLDAL